MQNVRGPSKSFPKHETRHISDHKVRIALLRPSSMRHMSLHLCHELNLRSSGQHYFLSANLGGTYARMLEATARNI
jgi:hypothetical protein